MTCVVDVGCHIGSFLSTVCGIAPRGQHVAVEASPTKAQWLKKRFPHVDVFACAAGETKGDAKFLEDADRPGFSHIVEDSEASVGVDVPMRTLNDMLAGRPRIDLIKLDIEGYEVAALRGADKIIGQHRPLILFECGPKPAQYVLMLIAGNSSI